MAATRLFRRFRDLLDVDWGAIADGQYLKRNGTSIDGGTPAGGGGTASRVLLGTATASASSQINVDNVVAADYDEYEIVWDSIVAASDNVSLEVIPRDSTPANITITAAVGEIVFAMLNAASAGAFKMTGTSGWKVSDGQGNAAGEISHGMLRLLVPASGTFHTGQFYSLWVSAAGNQTTAAGSNTANFAGTLAGFGLKFTAGNLASGTLKVYGIRNS